MALGHMDDHFCLSDSASPGKKGFFPGSHMIKEVTGEEAIGSTAKKEFRVKRTECLDQSSETLHSF